MATLVINPTYVSHEILFEADLDSIRVPLQNFLNVTKVDSNNIADKSLPESVLVPSLQQDLVQTGFIMEWAGTALPAGFLWCDGASYTAEQHAELYNVITVTYGGVLGTNFQVPDMRGRVAAGRDTMANTGPQVPANRITSAGSGIDASSVGAAGGNEKVSQHTHAVGTLITSGGTHVHAVADGGHNHLLYKTGIFAGSDTFLASNFSSSAMSGQPVGVVQTVQSLLNTTTTGSSHAHATTSGLTGNNTGSSGGNGVVQPTLVINYIIKT